MQEGFGGNYASKQDLELQITLDSWDAAARKARPAVPLPKRKR